MMSAEAIQKIIEMGHSKIEEYGVEGTHFHVNHRGASALAYPKRKAVECFSLTQLVSLIKVAIVDELTPLIVNAKDHQCVHVYTRLQDDNREPEIMAEADFEGMFEIFPFGKQLTQDEFVLNLMTKFGKEEQLTALLKFVSSVRSGTMTTSDDDGFSQEVQTKAGAHLTSTHGVQNLWHLKTFKTFPEIEQPVIPYILRLHQRDDETPKFALYECDGGKWKVETAIALREYLKNRFNNELGEQSDKVVVL